MNTKFDHLTNEAIFLKCYIFLHQLAVLNTYFSPIFSSIIFSKILTSAPGRHNPRHVDPRHAEHDRGADDAAGAGHGVRRLRRRQARHRRRLADK
jgi:hypothetical protein